MEADGGGLGHRAALGPQERLVELCWGREREGAARLEALEGSGAGLGVGPAVVDGLDPGGEEPVELDEGGDTAGSDLDEELVAHGAEEAFDLASALRAAWGGVGEADAEHCARPQQRGGNERGAVVDVDRGGHPSGGKTGSQGRLQADGVLGVAPPVAGDGPGMVVDEGEQVGLVALDHRAVEGVAGPTVVGGVGLEAPEGDRGGPVRARVQPEGGEVALDGAGRG